MEKEEPLSGRLVSDVLIELGRHTSDRQFAPDLVAMVEQGPCTSCLGAWDALARVGTAGYEGQLVKIAVSKGRGAADTAMRVLAFNGATDAVRVLAKQAEMVEAGERYLASHAEGNDRRWFPGRTRTFD
jgi:hypothetical protein